MPKFAHGSKGKIKYGFCQCGCGKKTKLAYQSNTELGWLKGEPIRFIRGHSGGRALNSPANFWPRVHKTNSCWLWTGRKMWNGYGQFDLGQKAVLPHRFAYELIKGPIPKGITLDHLCKVRHCVNPAHLEAVTMRENIMRGNGICAQKYRKARGLQLLEHPSDERLRALAQTEETFDKERKGDAGHSENNEGRIGQLGDHSDGSGFPL